jgi:uncharacterized protein
MSANIRGVFLDAVPQAFHWENQPLNWRADPNTLTITAGPKTDLFNNPQRNFSINNSPRLVFKPKSDFILRSKVDVGFKETYDAGVLLKYGNPNSWAKLCFELSPQGHATIVSVVNNYYSDDCNSQTISSGHVFLQVARIKESFAFHYSVDGNHWSLVRYFTVRNPNNIEAGFSAQSPKGESCTAIFDDIVYKPEMLLNIRG